jgi:tRNA (cmo5U34)-methyltransferase
MIKKNYGGVTKMSDLVKQRFDEAAEEYDKQRRLLIPCFDDFYGTAVNWVNVNTKQPRMLDLGAGTGLFSSYVKSKYPDSRITLIDLSEKMLDLAKLRFSANEEIDYIIADYTSYPFEEPFDAVISSLSIHHLPHEKKQSLFRTIYSLLKDGGVFVNADQVAGQTSLFDLHYKRWWEQSIRASGLSSEAVEAAIERRTLDINASARDQIQWLQEAGFVNADCVYRYHDFAVFAAFKL